MPLRSASQRFPRLGEPPFSNSSHSSLELLDASGNSADSHSSNRARSLTTRSNRNDEGSRSCHRGHSPRRSRKYKEHIAARVDRCLEWSVSGIRPMAFRKY